MKRPFDALIEIFHDYFKNNRADNRFIFEHADKINLWIVGFSIAGFSLLISNITGIEKSICPCVIRKILFLFTLSIVTGILFRIFFFLFYIYNYKIQIFLETAFSNKKYMSIQETDLSGETDYKTIVNKIKNDFGEDLSYLNELYDNINEENVKLGLLDSLKKHYSSLSRWSKKDYDNASNYVKETYMIGYGLSSGEYDKMIVRGKDAANWLKFYKRLSIICFLFSSVSFIIVLIIFSLNY